MKRKRLSAGLLFACGALLCGLVALCPSIRAASRVRGLTPVTAVALEGAPSAEEATWLLALAILQVAGYNLLETVWTNRL